MRYRTLPPSPFVVFADLSIALSFIFAVCAIAMSRILSDMTRDNGQGSLQSRVEGNVRGLYPDAVRSAAAWAKTDYDRRRAVEMKISNGDVVAKVSANGSYQRIELGKMYEFDGTTLLPSAERLLKDIAATIKESYLKGEIAYVYFHGVAEPGEAGGIESAVEAKRLSEVRAETVYGLFVREGAIARSVDEAYQASPSGRKPVAIDPRFAIDYGKARLYVRSKNPRNPTRIAGRVDILLFYTDSADAARNGG